MNNGTQEERKANILLVDDHEESLLALESILAGLNQNLIKATSGAEALRFLLRQDAALIILDIKMPEMDGFETAALIRQRDQSRHTPIIFLTGVHSREQQVFQGYSLGAVDYLIKPFAPEVLKSKAAIFVELFKMTENIKRQSHLLQAANEKLKQEISERNRLADIVDSSDDAIISISLEGLILSWNKGAERICGYFSDEILGQSISTLLHPDFSEEIKQIQNQIKARERADHFETTCRRKDGLSIDISLTVSPIKDSAGKIVGASAIARDITERKHLLREILDAGERERQRIGQDLHDDLCQQLTAIAFLAKALEQKLGGRALTETSEISKISELLDQATAHARDLAKGMIPAGVEISGLASALKIFVSSLESTTGVSCSFTDELGFVIEDVTIASHLYRIVQETVNNAIKHGQAKHVGIGLSAKDGKVNLTVYDDGVGIPDTLPSGQGVGLKSIRYRAGLIGAAVEIRKNPSGGTILTCSLPQARILPRRAPAKP